MIGRDGSVAPRSSAANACSCVTAWKLFRFSQRICAANSPGVTLSRCVIDASSGPILPMRWYMRIGSVMVRRGKVAGRRSVRRGGTGRTRRCADAGRATTTDAATVPEKRSSAAARKIARLDIEEADDSLS